MQTIAAKLPPQVQTDLQSRVEELRAQATKLTDSLTVSGMRYETAASRSREVEASIQRLVWALERHQRPPVIDFEPYEK